MMATPWMATPTGKRDMRWGEVALLLLLRPPACRAVKVHHDRKWTMVLCWLFVRENGFPLI